MPILNLVVTDIGYAALVNAAQTGTDAVEIAAVGLTAADFVAASSLTALPGEFRRLATIAGEATGPNTLNLVMRDDAALTYTVRGFGLYLADGALFAAFAGAGGETIIEKSTLASMMVTIDVAFVGVDTALIEFGDSTWTNPQATVERKGVVELATAAETVAGADAERAVTPSALNAAQQAFLTATINPALNLKANRSVTVTGGGLVTGGGDLSANRTLTVTEASAAEAIAGTIADKVITPRRLKAAIAALIDGAPGALDTLKELAAALGDDPNFATTIANQLALKATITYVDAQLAAARTQLLTERAGTFVWIGYDHAGLDLATMVLANGQMLDPANDPRLFARFGTTFGGDGVATFGVPEVRGEFFRALDLGRNVDTGRVLASSQAAAQTTYSLVSGPLAGTGFRYDPEEDSSDARMSLTPFAAETRPRNVAWPVAIWR